MDIGPNLVEAFATDGFVVINGVLSGHEVDTLLEAVARLPVDDKLRGGVRGVLGKSRTLREFAEFGAPAKLAKAILGAESRAVKGTIFDKNPQRNWHVPWHQDLTIAVEQQLDAPGFGPWSTKDGVPHVQPPAEVLEKVLAVRVHLDAAGPESGAIRVIPGSHRHGKLSPQEIDRHKLSGTEVVCPVDRGGLMLMAPLLLHASSATQEERPRRVLHVEYSALTLPHALRWAAS